MTRKIIFQVIGEPTIHCAGCEQRIGNALQRLSGVNEVKASAQTQRVVVEIDPNQVSPNEVQSRLELLGYEVKQGED